MQSINSSNLAARGARQRISRDFLSITVRNRGDGSPKQFHFWSGLHPIEAEIYNPDTSSAETRAFEAAGAMIAVSDIPRVANLTAQASVVEMLGNSDRVNTVLRTYDARQGIIEIYRGEQDPVTREMIAPAEPRYFGFIDSAPIKRGALAEGVDVKVTLNCKSHSQELTRANHAKVSDANQQRRAPGDNFFQDVAAAPEWEVFWGMAKQEPEE